MIHAAIFDMDGLLFDTERLCCDAWREVSAKAGYFMADELFFSCVGRNNRDTRDLVMAAMGSGFPYDTFCVDARKWMRERMELNGPPEKVGIRVLFDWLAAERVPIALATSTSETSARWMIERAGLTRYFSAFAFGSEVERGKPEPDIFLLALKRLSLSAGESIPSSGCAVFEDSPAGIKAAASAGMRPVFIRDMVAPEPAVRDLVWKEAESLDKAASRDFFAGL